MARLKNKSIVGQSGGCTQVINSSLRGVVEAGLKSKSITGIWGSRHGIEGVLEGDLIDLTRETPETIRAIVDRGAAVAKVVLHVGLGTFRPVSVEDPEEHEMESERYLITPGSADSINDARRKPWI